MQKTLRAQEECGFVILQAQRPGAWHQTRHVAASPTIYAEFLRRFHRFQGRFQALPSASNAWKLLQQRIGGRVSRNCFQGLENGGAVEALCRGEKWPARCLQRGAGLRSVWGGGLTHPAPAPASWRCQLDNGAQVAAAALLSFPSLLCLRPFGPESVIGTIVYNQQHIAAAAHWLQSKHRLLLVGRHAEGRGALVVHPLPGGGARDVGQPHLGVDAVGLNELVRLVHTCTAHPHAVRSEQFQAGGPSCRDHSGPQQHRGLAAKKAAAAALHAACCPSLRLNYASKTSRAVSVDLVRSTR